MIRNNRGMIGLGAAVLCLILVLVVSIVLLNYSYQASTFFIRQEAEFQNYQNAAFGANRGIWLLRQPTWMNPGGAARVFPYPEVGYETVPGAVDVTMKIEYAGGTYTITSIFGNKTLIARMANGKITSWD